MRKLNKKQKIMTVDIIANGQKVSKEFNVKKFNKLMKSMEFVKLWIYKNNATEEVGKKVTIEEYEFFKRVFEVEFKVNDIWDIEKFEIKGN